MAKEEPKEKKDNIKRVTIHSDDNTRVEIEKISNGWIIIEERKEKKKDGFIEYKSTKTYVEENPIKNIKIPK